jgi:hypothetical protein
MNFGLLLSHLPHVNEARPHYEAVLSLEAARPHRLANLWRRIKSRFS